MKRRILGLLLMCVMLCGAVTTVHAANAEAYNAADVLYDLGLFSGTGTKADGSPNFDLDRTPTRHEAVTMLVSLLGKKEGALAGEWETPFTDVVDWAKPFVGYAYENGLTSGTSATTYSGDAPLTAAQYFTFVLKALGYETGTDFQWDKSFEFAAQIGLTDGRYATAKDFMRGDVTLVSRNALDVKMKGSDQTLAEKLIAEGVFTSDAYKNSVENPLVLQQPASDFIPDVSFSIEGKMLDRSRGLGFRFDAGTYVVTPYLHGERFDEFEVTVEDGNGKVFKNSDGTFTVNYSGKDDMSIAFWYNFIPHTSVDANGKESVSYSRTKTSLSFCSAVPKSGFVLDWNGNNILAGKGFGGNMTPYFVVDVYYNGVRLEDYSVTAASGAPCSLTVQADGSLLIMKNGVGEGKFTVTYQGKSATFSVVCG